MGITEAIKSCKAGYHCRRNEWGLGFFCFADGDKLFYFDPRTKKRLPWSPTKGDEDSFDWMIIFPGGPFKPKMPGLPEDCATADPGVGDPTA